MIRGWESTGADAEPTEFAMYSADQYLEPTGNFTVEGAGDGSKWYKQTPEDTVKKTPYYNEKGEVRYHETIEKHLPQIPRRKDRV